MVEMQDVWVVLLFSPAVIWCGYRATNAARLYWSLSGIDLSGPTKLVDGEPTAIEGDVAVDDPAHAGERATDDADAPIAMYVWRTRFQKAGNNKIDFRNREIKPSMSTFASGVESGTFEVADGERAARVDPGWLVDAHESTTLSELEVGGIDSSDRLSVYPWDSHYVHLSDDATERPLGRMRGVVDTHNSDVDLDEYHFESKTVPEGETLAVRGEVQIEQGEPVVRGTDETPLFVSDEGFDGLRNALRRRTLKYLSYTGALVAVVVALVAA